jgi:hypothetical protein
MFTRRGLHRRVRVGIKVHARGCAHPPGIAVFVEIAWALAGFGLAAFIGVGVPLPALGGNRARLSILFTLFAYLFIFPLAASRLWLRLGSRSKTGSRGGLMSGSKGYGRLRKAGGE